MSLFMWSLEPIVHGQWSLTSLSHVQVFGTGEGGRRVSSGDRLHKRKRPQRKKRPVLPFKRNHSKKWQNKKRPSKKLRKGKLPRPSRPPPPPTQFVPFPDQKAQLPAANQNKAPNSPSSNLNTKSTGQVNSTSEEGVSTPSSYNSWSTTEQPSVTEIHKPTKSSKKPIFTVKPKKPFKFKSRSKQKEATALRGKLVHSIIHQDKSLEKEIYKTLEASLEHKEKEEVTTQRSSWQESVPTSNPPFYPTIASKLVEMPDPVPTAATETETESPGVTDQSRGLTSVPAADGSYSGDGIRRSMKNRGRVQSPMKKFKKFTSLKKRRPINGAFGAKLEPQNPSADHLMAPLESEERDETKNPISRKTNVSPEYGDSFVINYNDQEIKIKPSIVYDTSSTSHSTGSIIKELFSDQLGSRNYQTVREASNYSPSSFSPTPRPSYYSKPTSSNQAVSRNYQTIQEPSDFTPSPPYRPATTSPSYRVQSTPFYEEITPSPNFQGPTPTPSYQPQNYRDEALPSYTPTPHRRRDHLPTYSATPSPNKEDSYNSGSQELQEWQNTPVYSPSPEDTTYPKQHPRVKKQSAPPAEACDCHNVPLSPACSRQCPNIASDRQGLGPQIPIVSQTQEHNQDPAQSHAFE